MKVPNVMEYSVANNSGNISELYGSPFPLLSSQPAHDLVNPGLGQMVNLFDVIVPMRGRALHTIEKKVELQEDTSEEKIEAKDQIGAGKLNVEIAESFQKPIVTDSIVFPKEEGEKNAKIKVRLLQTRKLKLLISLMLFKWNRN